LSGARSHQRTIFASRTCFRSSGHGRSVLETRKLVEAIEVRTAVAPAAGGLRPNARRGARPWGGSRELSLILHRVSMFLLYRELNRIIVREKGKLHRVRPETTACENGPELSRPVPCLPRTDVWSAFSATRSVFSATTTRHTARRHRETTAPGSSTTLVKPSAHGLLGATWPE